LIYVGDALHNLELRGWHLQNFEQVCAIHGRFSSKLLQHESDVFAIRVTQVELSTLVRRLRSKGKC